MMLKLMITTSTFAKYDPKLVDVLTDQGLQIILNPYGRKLTEGEVIKLIDKYQPVGMIAGVEPLTQKVLERAKNLKVISRCGIGLDSIDMKAAKYLGIIVMNTPNATTIPVAELTMGMILSLLRHLHIVDTNIRQGKWERPMGLLLKGKTVGIIGCGRIGSYLAKLLFNFCCDILGFDPNVKKHEQIKMVTLIDLLVKSDIVTIHIPYSKENHHFIDKKRLKTMKRGAILINTARGGLVDEQALFNSLKSRHLLGAALDCYEDEPYKGNLRSLDNILLSSHIGSYAKEGRIMMEQQATENLISELKKQGVIP